MATCKVHQVDTKGICDDGSSFQARIHAFTLFNPTGQITGFNVIIEDVAERYQIEYKLHMHKEKYMALFNNAEVLLF